MRLDLSQIFVEPLLPKELLSGISSEEFMTLLPKYDSHFEELKKSAADNDSVLRYVGTITSTSTEIRLLSLKKDHAISQLQGSDSVVSIKSSTFPSPLVIRGAGAGRDVTVFGMLSDLRAIK
jgi:aspartokinase/homoserine dehydrogenase 1